MKNLSVMVLALLTLFVVASPARAAEFQSGSSYNLSSDETVSDDLYVGAEDITIDGTVERGAILAGRTIIVSGEIKGDLQAIGETIRITGKVDGTVRVAGSSVTITGDIGRDVFTAAAQTTLDSDATVTGSVLSASGQVDVDGKVGQDLRVAGSIVNLRGSVAGNGYINSGQIEFGTSGIILGNLSYTSPEKLSPQDQQKVTGTLDYHETTKQASDYGWNREMSLTAKIVGQAFMRAYAAIALIVIAVVALWLIPVIPQNIKRQTKEKMGRNLGMGALYFFITPFAILAFFCTLIGIPLAALLGGVYAVAWGLAILPVAYLVGTKIMAASAGANRYAVIIVGIIVTELAVGVLKLIPFVGSLVVFVVSVWGFGVIVTALWHMVRGERNVKTAVESVK